MPFLSRLGFQKRIMLYVTVGLVAIALVYTFVGLQAIEQSTAMVFHERLTMAQTVAGQVDSLLAHVVEELEGSAADVAPALETDDPQIVRAALDTLYHHWAVYHHFTEPCTVSLVAPDGRVLWSEPLRLGVVGTSIALLPDFRALTDSESFSVTHSPLGAVLNRPVVSVAVPVRRDSRTLAYLIGEIEPTHASHRLAPNLTIADAGYAAELIDEGGEVLVSTEAGREGKPSIHNRLFADRLQAQQATVRVHEAPAGGDERGHLVAYAPLEHVPWSVFVEQETDLALGLPRRLRSRLALFGLFALVAGLTTTWLLTRSVVRPVTQLIAAARRIASGDLDHAVAVQGQDEIGQLAAAFERMRQELVAQRQRVQDLAILEERDRLAREMHDGFAQALSVLNLAAQTARRALLAGDGAGATRALDGLDHIVDQAYADVREAISGLRTLVPHEEGLIATVSQYLEEFGLQYSLATEFHIIEGTEEIAFTAAQEIQVLRIIQEALSNVRKHAAADQVLVRFQRIGDAVQITIADDGIGFDPSPSTSSGQAPSTGSGHRLAAVERTPRRTFGLAIMRERAESLGGLFCLETRPGAGTTVTVQIPLEQEGSDHHGASARSAGR